MSDIQATQILDFSQYIVERTKHFTGREWVFQTINDWLLKQNASRYFLLRGDPGSGKSAIAARLCQSSLGEIPPPEGCPALARNSLGAFHFCSARSGRWMDPSVFAESLAMQLASRHPEFSKALAEKGGDRQIRIEVDQRADDVSGTIVGVVIKSLDVSALSAEDTFNRVVREPFQTFCQTRPGRRIVILVDALDEARAYTGRINIVELLARAGDLPEGVRWILTGRKDAQVENEFPGAEGLYLSAAEFDQRNQADISHYVRSRLREDEQLSAKAVTCKPARLTELIDTIATKSAGNLQYVTLLMDSMAKGKRALDELEGLPSGLDGLYYDSLDRVVKLGRDDWAKDYASLMGVLSVACDSLTFQQLKVLTGQSETALWDHLSDLEQFIREMKVKDGQDQEVLKYALYHQSLIDFLRRRSLMVDKKELRNRYYLPPNDQHRRIVDCYRGKAKDWEKRDWRKVDDYGLSHLASHLYALRDDLEYREELYRLICWPLMEAKRVRIGSVRSFANDVDLAFQMAAAQEPLNWPHLSRFSFLRGTLNRLAANAPPQMLALLAQASRLREAEGYAALIQDPDQQSEAYQHISAALLAKGELGQAAAIAQRITVAWRRAIALIPLLDRTNVPTNRGELVTQALSEGGPGGQQPPLSGCLRALAAVVAQTGDIEQLDRIVLTLPNEHQRAILLQEAIPILAHARSLPSTEQLFSWIIALENAQDKSEVFAAFVSELIRQNDSDAIRQALDWLTTLGFEGQKARIVAALAPYVALHGSLVQLEQIQGLSQQLHGDVHARLHALSAVARAAAQMGDRSRVSDLVPEIVALGELDAREDPLGLAAMVFSQSNIAETLAVIGAEPEARRAIEQALSAANRSRFAPPFGEVTVEELLDIALILAQTGAVDSALALAEFGSTVVARAYLRCRIAAVLAGTGETKRAQALAEDVEAFARDIQDPIDKATLLGWVLHAQLHLGNRERAADLVDIVLSSVQLVEDQATRARLLGEASSLLEQFDDPERARDVAMQAATEAEAVKDIAAKIVVLGNVVATSPPAVKQPLLDRTAQLVDEIRDRASQIGDLNQVVQALAQIGLTDHAMEIASLSDNVTHKGDLLIAIMRGTWSLEPRLVRETAVRCREKASDIAFIDDKALALEFVARTLLVAKDYAEALAVAASIKHPALVPQALAKIAVALAETEDKQRADALALRTLQALTPDLSAQIQTRVLSDVARAYAHLGQDRKASDLIARAESVATAIGSAQTGSDPVGTRELIRVAETLRLMGKQQKSSEIAQRVVQMVKFNNRIAYGLAPVVRALALLGDYDAAMELLTTIEGPAGFSLETVVEPLLQMGKFNETLMLAERVGIEGQGGYVLADIAVALAKAPVETPTIQYANRILQLVKSLRQEWVKARTLGEIAFVLAVARETERPKALARKALEAFKTQKEDVPFKREVVERVAGVFGLLSDREGLDLAMECAAELEGKSGQMTAQIAIAQAFLSIGAVERTIDIASRAVESAKVEDDQHFYAQARMLSMMSQILADLGEPEEARAIAQHAAAAAKAIRYYAGQVLGEVDKDGALAAVALAFARSGAIDEALVIAPRIINKLDQACVLREAARGFMRGGSRDQALDVAEQAKTMALEHEETIDKTYMLCAAAEALAAIGDGTGVDVMLRRVQGMKRHFKNMANRAQVWSVMSQVFTQAGAGRLAVDAAQAAWDDARNSLQRWDRIWALLAAGGAMAGAGMKPEAANAARQALAVLDGLNSLSEGFSQDSRLYPMTRFNTAFARIALGIPWRSELAVLLVATQVFIDADHRPQAAATAERAMASANAITGDAQRLVALSLVSGTMTAVRQQERALASLLTALKLAYKSGRPQVLEVLGAGAVTIAAMDQGQQIRETATAIVEIIDRWPPEARTLEQATDQHGMWHTVIRAAGPRGFEE